MKKKPDANDILRTQGEDALRAHLDSNVRPFKPSESDGEITCASWWRDPETIPRRGFLYGRHLSRRNVSATVGAGGRMKTSHGLFELVEMAAGRDLMKGTELPDGPLCVACLNAEEDQDELDRRVAAICQRYQVVRDDIEDKLFVKSIRRHPLRLAAIEKGQAVLDRAALDRLLRFVKRNQLDVLMLDPFVSFHAVNESSNMDMDLLIKEGLGGIAEETDSAIEISHHPGKPKPGQAETTVEDARGASAIIWAVRSARVFNFMTPEEAKNLGIKEDDRRRHVRIANGKANMGPIGRAEWIKIEVENLPNGDEIACASRWKPPDPFEGITTDHMRSAAKLAQTGAYRADSRAREWFGYAVAPMLNIDVAYGAENDPADIARLRRIIRTWRKNKVLDVEEREDDQRHKRDFVIAGKFNGGSDEGDDDFLLQ